MTESAIDDVATDVAVPRALTGADLQRLGRGLPAMFDVTLVTDAGPATLHCEMVLRVQPGRRIVLRAAWPMPMQNAACINPPGRSTSSMQREQAMPSPRR